MIISVIERADRGPRFLESCTGLISEMPEASQRSKCGWKAMLGGPGG